MTTYYYYPSTSRSSRSRSPYDRMTTTRTSRSVSPLPPLSRSSTPASEGPATPKLSSSLPHTPKSGKHQVGFASPVASSYRIPEYDERSVMRAFASHATYCERCCDPERVVRRGDTLCRTGTELAKDIGQYFYCLDGKPYSTIDRSRRGERVQVEVPVEYSVVKNLFEALSRGLKFTSLKQKRAEVHQGGRSTPSPSRPAPTTESYEIKPSRSGSRRQRTNTYTGHSSAPEYETRTPYDDKYRGDPRRESKRGSLYVPDERRSKRQSTYVLPFSSGWLG